MTTPAPEQLLEDINQALIADTRYDVDDLQIRLSDDGATIVVNGRVNGIEAKRLAANTVRQAAGDRSVVDRLSVAAQPAGELELRDEVGRALAGEPMFSDTTITTSAASEHDVLHDGGADAPRIDIHVAGQVVTLNGRVPSLSHRRFAEVLAWWAPGCERVDNELQVEPAERDTDNEITDAVRMVLEKDPLVRADQLLPGTAGGVVELRGLVASDEERRLAVRDAWYVPGVWSVVDHIEVRPRSG